MALIELDLPSFRRDKALLPRYLPDIPCKGKVFYRVQDGDSQDVRHFTLRVFPTKILLEAGMPPKISNVIWKSEKTGTGDVEPDNADAAGGAHDADNANNADDADDADEADDADDRDDAADTGRATEEAFEKGQENCESDERRFQGRSRTAAAVVLLPASQELPRLPRMLAGGKMFGAAASGGIGAAFRGRGHTKGGQIKKDAIQEKSELAIRICDQITKDFMVSGAEVKGISGFRDAYGSVNDLIYLDKGIGLQSDGWASVLTLGGRIP
ncbi:hypothetical protein DL765_006889 [Monosporascus sp. GIB2]|nr:hypothetical protein DL765_006889 [Monosporascus sp. GIB2]